jgi:hypothetical protein
MAKALDYLSGLLRQQRQLSDSQGVRENLEPFRLRDKRHARPIPLREHPVFRGPIHPR